MRSSIFDMAGQVAIVTGSSKGIGRAIATRLAEQGARVVVSSRKAEACQVVSDEINAAGGESVVIACNISRKGELQKLVDETNAKWGRIDALICNAAINPYYGGGLGISDEQFDKIMGTNVRSNMWLTNMVIPQMAEAGGGAIVIISSIGGLAGSPVIGAYCISKAADMQLARNIAVEWGPKNIRANCIAPGLVRTDFARALWEDPVKYKSRTAGTPLKRIGEPDEIAGAAVFLASKAGSFTTGQTFVIDGGVTIGSSIVEE